MKRTKRVLGFVGLAKQGLLRSCGHGAMLAAFCAVLIVPLSARASQILATGAAGAATSNAVVTAVDDFVSVPLISSLIPSGESRTRQAATNEQVELLSTETIGSGESTPQADTMSARGILAAIFVVFVMGLAAYNMRRQGVREYRFGAKSNRPAA